MNFLKNWMWIKQKDKGGSHLLLVRVSSLTLLKTQQTEKRKTGFSECRISSDGKWTEERNTEVLFKNTQSELFLEKKDPFTHLLLGNFDQGPPLQYTLAFLQKQNWQADQKSCFCYCHSPRVTWSQARKKEEKGSNSGLYSPSLKERLVTPHCSTECLMSGSGYMNSGRFLNNLVVADWLSTSGTIDWSVVRPQWDHKQKASIWRIDCIFLLGVTFPIMGSMALTNRITERSDSYLNTEKKNSFRHFSCSSSPVHRVL